MRNLKTFVYFINLIYLESDFDSSKIQKINQQKKSYSVENLKSTDKQNFLIQTIHN